MEAEAAPVRKELNLTGEGNPLAEGISARLWSNESVHVAVSYTHLTLPTKRIV